MERSPDKAGARSSPYRGLGPLEFLASSFKVLHVLRGRCRDCHSHRIPSCWSAVTVLPPFNEHGVLPPGRYPTTADEVEQRFVQTFPASLTRRALFDGWRRRRGELFDIVEIEAEWLDGSFVTSKSDAGDIDVVVLVEATRVDSLAIESRRRLFELTNGPRPLLEFGCHSFIVPTHPEGHSRHANYLESRGYWDRQWSRDRRAPEKGYLDVRGGP